MGKGRGILGRVRLWHLLFGFLVVFGILPIVFSTVVNLRRNRDLLEQEEKVNLSRQAEHLSRALGLELEVVSRQLGQLGAGLASPPATSARARNQWIEGYLRSFVEATGADFTTRVSQPGSDRAFGATLPERLAADLDRVLRGAAENASEDGSPSFEFVSTLAEQFPWVVVTRKVPGADFVLQAAKPLPVTVEEGQGVFLLDQLNGGSVLWADQAQAQLVRSAVERSDAVQDGLRNASGAYQVLEYAMRIGSSSRQMIGQLGKVGETSWVVLLQKPKEAALRAAGDLVKNASITGLVTVLLASLFGVGASRVLSQPIQRLAETTREIASGHFGKRVEARGAGMEIVDLAESFNAMSSHVEDHVARLREAARVNHELFIGTIRSLLAAVEAKEPYTRGHSERVASYSQAIARHLTDHRDFLEQIWVAGLLHDVGKIGIEDRVLNKGDKLTEEEYEIMKRHPVVGAEIMSSIEQLKTALPAIRWHHERWTGGGYPDGLVGEDIPFMARIVAVADTFDAITTQRVYQDPYTPEQAIEIVRKLDGTNFDPRVVKAFLKAYESGDIQVQPMTRAQAPVRPVDEAAVRPVDEAAPVHT